MPSLPASQTGTFSQSFIKIQTDMAYSHDMFGLGIKKKEPVSKTEAPAEPEKPAEQPKEPEKEEK